MEIQNNAKLLELNFSIKKFNECFVHNMIQQKNLIRTYNAAFQGLPVIFLKTRCRNPKFSLSKRLRPFK